jgi:soluble lytic murein transglycosylase
MSVNRVRTRPSAVAIFFLLSGVALAFWWWSGSRREHRHDRCILAAALRYRVDPALVKAVVWKESRFDSGARGKAGEIGLMQLQDPAANEWAEATGVYPLAEAHLYDPLTNVLAGTWYLQKVLQRYRAADHPEVFALADYNAGRGNVRRWAKGAAATNSAAFLVQIGFPGTREYIESILERRTHYRRDFPSASASP